MDPKAYYDRFSENYEKGRDRGYHAILDDLEASLVTPFAIGGRVLEAGCGTGLVLSRIGARSRVGADISSGMLARARARGHRVVQSDLTRLPFRDGAFDVVCSFKVLAHVPDRAAALAELARVTRPGGKLVLEFYNRHSLRYLVKRIGPAFSVANGTRESDVFTRFDSLRELAAALPSGVRLVGHRGIRVFTPFAQLIDIPVLGPLVAALERRAFDSAVGRFGGFLVIVAEKADR